MLKNQIVHKIRGTCQLCKEYENITKTEICMNTKGEKKEHGLVWLCDKCRKSLKYELRKGGFNEL